MERAATRGALFGLMAAALFGLSAPIAKRLLGEVAPELLAGLLYLGAGLCFSAWRAVRPSAAETGLKREDLPALLGIIVSGGVVGPVLMLVGLSRVTAVEGSLLLNLEGPFTIAIAVLIFREHLGRYGFAAVFLILLGAALLRVESGAIAPSLWGALSIAGACAAWGIDNNLTQRLSLRDPFALVRVKTLASGVLNLVLALLLGAELPALATTLIALVVGALSYGVSVLLDAYALRLVGAAREAAYFATAPFVGALASVAIVGEALRARDVAAMGLMVVGVLALLRERHAHPHEHPAMDHEHLHHHDAHHQHPHGPGDPPGEPHAHAHHHDALVHDHPHVPDLHHRHRH